MKQFDNVLVTRTSTYDLHGKIETVHYGKVRVAFTASAQRRNFNEADFEQNDGVWHVAMAKVIPDEL